MSKQTIKVEIIRAKVNTALENWPIGRTPEEIERAKNIRFGIGSALEMILHETGNYRGFGYLGGRYIAGETDESRRFYY